MVRTQTLSLQNTLNGLMNTASKDTLVTRLWSTCPSMLTIHGIKGKNEDKLAYIIDDSTLPLPLSSVLKRVLESSLQMLKVTVAEQKRVNASFGDLYAHFLIEGHTHTTHYVNLSKEFPINTDVDAKLTALSSKCMNSVYNTKIIVMVECDSTEKTDGDLNPTVTSEDSEQSTSKEFEIASRTNKELTCKEILKKLLERLLIDGIDKVLVLTNPDGTMAFPSLFEEVIQKVKEVSINTDLKK
jgi:hypothetical protein